ETVGDVLPSASLDGGELAQRRLELTHERLRTRAELAEERPNHAFLLLEQGEEEMLRLDRLVTTLHGQRLRGLDGFLCFHGELVELHVVLSVRRFLSP